MLTISVPVFATDVAETGEFEIVSITLDNPTPKALETVNYTIKTKGDSSKYVIGSIVYLDDADANRGTGLSIYKIDSNEYRGSFTVGENMEGDLSADSIIFSDGNEDITLLSNYSNPEIDWDSLKLNISSDSEVQSDEEPPILQSATVNSDSISTTGEFYVDMIVTDNIYADPYIMVEYSVDDMEDFQLAYPIGENTYRATFDADDLEADGIIKFDSIYICDGSGNSVEYTYSGEDGAIKIDYPLDVERIKSETDSEVTSDTDSTTDTDSEVTSDTDSTTDTDSEVTSDTDSTTDTDSEVTSDTDSTTDSDSEVITESSVKESKTDSAIVNDNSKNNDEAANPNTGFGNLMWVYILSGVVLSAVIFIVYKKKSFKNQ